MQGRDTSEDVFRSMEPAVKRRLRALVLPVLFLVVTAYFVFNAINGSRGIIAQRHDQAVLVKDRQSLTDVTARRDRWQARVDALHHHAIAPDMLNEQARAVLNLADPDDLAVPLHPAPAPASSAPAAPTPAAPGRPHS
ncbi:septum formation initiator family protein [Acidiphilium sp.]|uniref:FtsB family cell division protein n=1 Tax=Acidiphilium sp. TaxID=527 RepID=UPI00258F1A55|nr:septum formation initiator family protein [Acidiphilium sp.]